jgi:hypothetical protein
MGQYVPLWANLTNKSVTTDATPCSKIRRALFIGKRSGTRIVTAILFCVCYEELQWVLLLILLMGKDLYFPPY